MKHLLHLTCLALLSSTPALGQASGFQRGELIYYSQAIPNTPPTGAGIVRIDPTTGVTVPLFTLWNAYSRRDALAFDAFRERVVFYGQFPDFTTPPRLYALDGFGNTTILGYEDENVMCFAPASGGRFYLLNESNGQIQYLDASDQRHVLMDVAGTQPYIGGGVDVWAMVYDAATNSLFAGTSRVSSWTCGLNPNSRVVRLPLSDDGSKLRAAPECVEIVVDPTVGSAPSALTHGPDGKLLVGITVSTSGPLPSLALVDPVTLDVTPFAFPDYQGSVDAGVWSRTLERALIVNLFSDDLRSYDAGEAGPGTIVDPSMAISPPGGPGEGICMVEISRGEGTVVQPYCEPKVTAAGCVPDVQADGVASVSSPSGFLIEAREVPPQRMGLFFYGVSGPAAIPFLGGTKCMRRSPVRTSPTNSGNAGAGTCGGVFSIDFNAYMNSGAGPQLGPGTVVWGQFWFRDPTHPVAGVGLSNAITFTVLP